MGAKKARTAGTHGYSTIWLAENPPLPEIAVPLRRAYLGMRESEKHFVMRLGLTIADASLLGEGWFHSAPGIFLAVSAAATVGALAGMLRQGHKNAESANDYCRVLQNGHGVGYPSDRLDAMAKGHDPVEFAELQRKAEALSHVDVDFNRREREMASRIAAEEARNRPKVAQRNSESTEMEWWYYQGAERKRRKHMHFDSVIPGRDRALPGDAQTP